MGHAHLTDEGVVSIGRAGSEDPNPKSRYGDEL